MSKRRPIALILLLVLTLSGCDTTEFTDAPQTLVVPTQEEPRRLAKAEAPPSAVPPAPEVGRDSKTNDIQRVPSTATNLSAEKTPAEPAPKAVAMAPVKATLAAAPLIPEAIPPVTVAPSTTVTSANLNLIKIDGSSTVYPISKQIADEFQKMNPAIKVEVGLSGTGGGFKKFCPGETDISDASRPITQKEMDQAALTGIDFIEIPVAFDGLSIVVNPKNTAVNSLTVAELKTMWKPDSTVKTWRDVRPEFPNEVITFTGASPDNGTYDFFTEAIVGDRRSRHNYITAHDPATNVTRVEEDTWAISYFGYAYYLQNKDRLKILGVDDGKGAVLPSESTVLNGSYHPLSRPLFIYVSSRALQRPEVDAFVRFYLNRVAEVCKTVGYIPLPEQAYKFYNDRYARRSTGTVFGGAHGHGISLDDAIGNRKPVAAGSPIKSVQSPEAVATLAPRVVPQAPIATILPPEKPPVPDITKAAGAAPATTDTPSAPAPAAEKNISTLPSAAAKSGPEVRSSVAPPPATPDNSAPVTIVDVDAPNLSGIVTIDGSSTVYPISKAIADEFKKRHPGVQIEVGLSGTGGGFKKFCPGGTDISDASRPINQKEVEQIGLAGIQFLEIPVAYDGLSVVVNLKNASVNSLTVDELKLMWKPDSTVKSWRDIRPQFDEGHVTFTGPTPDNGTYDFFNEEIVGDKRSRHDYMSTHDPELSVKRVESNVGAISYFGYAYYLEHKDQLKLLAIDNGKGPVYPSIESVLSGEYAPLSRPLFIYVSVKGLMRPEVEAFTRFYLANAAAISKRVGYIPLPAKAYQYFNARYANRIAGTVFGGAHGKGVKLDDVIK